MGIFDRLTDTLLSDNKDNDPRNELIAPLITIIEKQEGLAGLVDMFLRHERDADSSSQKSSSSSGAIAEVEHAFGQEFLQAYAQQLGLAPAEAADRLASNVPRYIDELIEKGEWSKPSDYLDTAMEVLKTKTIN